MISMAKRACLEIVEYSPAVIILYQRQRRLGVHDMLTHCGADDNLKWFLNIEAGKYIRTILLRAVW
jgi:hypothetical protein